MTCWLTELCFISLRELLCTAPLVEATNWNQNQALCALFAVLCVQCAHLIWWLFICIMPEKFVSGNIAQYLFPVIFSLSWGSWILVMCKSKQFCYHISKFQGQHVKPKISKVKGISDVSKLLHKQSSDVTWWHQLRELKWAHKFIISSCDTFCHYLQIFLHVQSCEVDLRSDRMR